MVTSDIQQVTTRCKAKQSEWDIQDEIRKEAKNWIEIANSKNVNRMQHDMQNMTIDNSQSK